MCAETGESALRKALERIWRDVVDTKMYVTGAIGALHHGVSIRHDRVHEAFGGPYELPSRTAYNETCANIGNAMWCRRMLLLTGQAGYADVMERVLYNSALSPMSIDGTRFCYTNPLSRRQDAPLLSHDTRERWFVHRCYCCPPSVARTLAAVHTWAFSLTADSVGIHLYGSSTLATRLPGGGEVRVTQKTSYPWDGQVTVTVEKAPAELAAVRLRIPGWAEKAKIRINGQTTAADPKPSTSVELRRDWADGDVIELTVPMNTFLVEAHPHVEATLGRVAVCRGPVVYCLESADLPAGVDLDEVRLSWGAEWKARHVPDLLGGVTVLETTALVRDRDPQTSLYRRVEKKPPRPVLIRLVPYYAWNNRGPGDMAVWLPIE